MHLTEVTSADGTRLSVRVSGPADAPPILLIHGWSQHSLSWSRQLSSDLALRFRLVAPDLRGCGGSDKPTVPEAYTDARRWAEDIAAIIEALALDRPLAVGWSMGGKVLGDYIAHFGDAALSGVVLIGSPLVVPPGLEHLRSERVVNERLYSHDDAEALPAMMEFLRACTAQPLPAEEFAYWTGLNMLCPPDVRRWSRNRAADYAVAFAGLTRPAWYLYGDAEEVAAPPIARASAALLPQVHTIVYPGSGHAPFWEASEVFNADLARIATDAAGRSRKEMRA